ESGTRASLDSLTCVPVTVLGRSLFPAIVARRILAPLICVTAYDEPPSATNSARIATPSAGDGRGTRRRLDVPRVPMVDGDARADQPIPVPSAGLRCFAKGRTRNTKSG